MIFIIHNTGVSLANDLPRLTYRDRRSIAEYAIRIMRENWYYLRMRFYFKYFMSQQLAIRMPNYEKYKHESESGRAAMARVQEEERRGRIRANLSSNKPDLSDALYIERYLDEL